MLSIPTTVIYEEKFIKICYIPAIPTANRPQPEYIGCSNSVIAFIKGSLKVMQEMQLFLGTINFFKIQEFFPINYSKL